LAEVKKIENQRTKKKNRFFSYLVLSVSALLLFLTLVVSITQTSYFRGWLKDYIVETLNESFQEKQSSLSIGSLEGNFFSEIIVSDAILKVKQDEMVRFERLKVNFNIFGLLDKNVQVTEAVLNNPSVNLTRIIGSKGDSVWNFAHLFSSEDTAKDTSEFDWKISVHRLRIENLNFVMLGTKPQDIPVSAINILPEESFTTENLKINGLSIETRAEYDKNSVQLWIDHLGFRSNFGFNLKGLSGDFYISRSRAEINNLNIESSRSWVQMEYVFIDKLDLMNIEGLPSFKGKDLRMSLVGKNFDFDDLKAFLPAVDFLDGDLFFELKAKGKFDDILVEKCRIETPNTNMGFSGRMKNLVDPENLWFDVKSNEFRIDPEDTKRYTPGLPIPDYTHLGVVTGNISYKGEPLDFESTFDVKSSAGNAKGFFNLNLKTQNFNYSTSVEFTGGNIGKVIKDQKLESNLNGKVEAEGSGFDLAVINTALKYELRDSKIYEQKIDRSAGTINLRGYNIETDISYASGKFDAVVKGNVNVRDFNNPVYDLKGEVRNLDISMFTKDQADKSSLTFAFDLNGRGISPEGLEGSYDIQLANSYYGEYDFIATPINLKISTSGASDNVTLSSNLIDFNAKGSFKIEEIGSVIASNIVMIQNEISKKFNLDTLFPVKSNRISGADMDFTYELRTKDPEAVSKMFFLNDISFEGDVKGSIKNSALEFNGKSTVNLKRFVYKDTVLILSDTRAEFVHTNTYANYKDAPKGDFSSFSSTIDVDVGRMRNNSNVFDSVSAKVVLSSSTQAMYIKGKKDSTINAELAGTIDLSQDTIRLDMSKIDFFYNRFHIKNADPVVLGYDPSANEKTITFHKFALTSDIVSVDLHGDISLGGESNFTADFTNIDIPSVLQYVYDPKSVYAVKESQKFKSPLKGKIRRISMYMKGNFSDPQLSMEMNTGIIRYDQIKIGRLDAFIDYANQNLATEVFVSNTQAQGSLRLTGNIPFNNPFQTPDSATYVQVLTKPLDLNLKASNFQINFFSKLIPNFSDIRGFLNGEIIAQGTVAEPVLSGNATIDKGRFFFSWNGLYYRFEASFKTDKSDLIVEQFSVYNDKDLARHIDVFGRINFAGLSVNDIDLTTRGDVYFLDGTSIQNRFGFYGDMLAGIGDPPIRIKGNLSDLLVSGQLVIKSAKIYFPGISSLAYDVYSDDFTYRILTDERGFRFLDTTIVVTKDDLDDIDPFLRYNYILDKREPTVADYITYDLDILMEKNIQVKINMNSLTREELNGEFQGNLKLDNRTPDKRFQLFGRLNIVGDSYYRFYKNFRIEDSYLEFYGDYNDPKLDIVAEYKNIRTVNSGDQEIMYVVLDIEGTRYKPELTLSLRSEDGSTETGSEAQTKAISYLLFGAPTLVGSSALSNIGTNVGSNVASSILYEAIRDIAPFIQNTELIYTGGDISATDIRITSAFGDAIVKLGGKILTNINNLEASVEYPLNKLFNMNVSNNLIIEIARVYSTSLFNLDQGFETRAGLTYKIRY
jgi:TamB, inner membrane protein subunit of TAM complex